MLQKFKQYQNQIFIAFKRFPIVIGFAFYAAISFTAFYLLEKSYLFESTRYLSKLLIWLALYPVPAMFLSYALTLRDEFLQKRNPKVHAIAQAAWLIVFLVVLQFYPQHFRECSGLFSSLSLVLLVSPFVVPFKRISSDLSLWRFIGKNIKAVVTGVLVTAVLNAAVAFLLFAIHTIFDADISEKVWVILIIFCWSVVFPILFLSSVPDVTNDATVHHKKFAINVTRFLFIPIHLLYIAFLYAYGLKIIFLHADYDMVSVFVSIAIASMLIITTIIYPSHFDSEQKMDRRFLKVLPLLALPLLIAQVIDIAIQIRDTCASIEQIYMVYLTIWFFIAIAISLICIKRKIRWLIISFCTVFFLSAVGPQSAYSISKRVLVAELEGFLKERGYTEFPLDCSNYKVLFHSLIKKETNEFNKLNSLRNNIAQTFGEAELAKYIPAGLYDECVYDEPIEIDSTRISLYASNLIVSPYPIPKKRNLAIYWKDHVKEESFNIKNDTLFIEFQLTTSDSLSTYNYSIPLDSLKDRDGGEGRENIPVILEDEYSTFVVEDFSLEHNKDSQSLYLKGIVYLSNR